MPSTIIASGAAAGATIASGWSMKLRHQRRTGRTGVPTKCSRRWASSAPRQSVLTKPWAVKLPCRAPFHRHGDQRPWGEQVEHQHQRHRRQRRLAQRHPWPAGCPAARCWKTPAQPDGDCPLRPARNPSRPPGGRGRRRSGSCRKSHQRRASTGGRRDKVAHHAEQHRRHRHRETKRDRLSDIAVGQPEKHQPIADKTSANGGAARGKLVEMQTSEEIRACDQREAAG